MSAPVNVTLVDYGVGNIASVRRAFERLGAAVDLTADPERVASGSRVVLPGVGAFRPARERLASLGLDAAIVGAARAGARLLGLCLGFQLLFEESEEFGIAPGLALVGGRVTPFAAGTRTPHVGWNGLVKERPSRLLAGVADGAYVYFVHSYRAEGVSTADVAASCDHGGAFPAALEAGNVWGCQFHPEKSSGAGRSILEAFLDE